MATCPPIARDRLIGLADVSKNLVNVMEAGKLPARMEAGDLHANLRRVANTITKMLDIDIFPWIPKKTQATKEERYRSATIIADRLCGAVCDPIVRNAQEQRQLALIVLPEAQWLQAQAPCAFPFTDRDGDRDV